MKNSLPPQNRNGLEFQHEALVVPIRENRPGEAERMMRAHIASGTRGMMEQLADGTFRMEPVEE